MNLPNRCSFSLRLNHKVAMKQQETVNGKQLVYTWSSEKPRQSENLSEEKFARGVEGTLTLQLEQASLTTLDHVVFFTLKLRRNKIPRGEPTLLVCHFHLSLVESSVFTDTPAAVPRC